MIVSPIELLIIGQNETLGLISEASKGQCLLINYICYQYNINRKYFNFTNFNEQLVNKNHCIYFHMYVTDVYICKYLLSLNNV